MTGVLLLVSIWQERHKDTTLRAEICKKGYAVECLVFLLLFFSVVVFASYGPGTDPADFYYMQF